MRKKSNSAPVTVVDGLKSVVSSLAEIAAANKELAARERRMQGLVAKLVRMAGGYHDQLALLKLQEAMQRENQIFTSVSNVLKTRHDTAKNAIGNIR